MGLAVGKVKLSDYDYNWPKQFEEEKANLRQIFGDSVPIEHVGSTSIEGISAKPIIDIAVGLDRLEDFENYRELFQKDPNYSIKDDSDKDEVLVRRGSEENRTHFIHISEKTSTRFNNYLKFRDYMREHADARNKYEQLKQELQELAVDQKRVVENKREEISVLRVQIDGYKKKFDELPDHDKEAAIMGSDIVVAFQKMASVKPKSQVPTVGDWQRLMGMFAKSIPKFYEGILLNDDLTKLEKEICMLCRLNFSNGQISVLLDKSTQSVTNTKSKVNIKLFGQKTVTSFKKNLQSM